MGLSTSQIAFAPFVIKAVADICKAGSGLPIEVTGAEFSSTRPVDQNHRGMRAIHGQADGDAITVTAELARVPRLALASVGLMYQHLARLGSQVELVDCEAEAGADQLPLLVRFGVSASTPLTKDRADNLFSVIKRVREAACAIQSCLPSVPQDEAARVKRYEAIADHVRPVAPWPASVVSDLSPILTEWAEETADLMQGSACVGVTAPHPIEQDFALAGVAHALEQAGGTLGQITASALSPSDLISLIAKAPDVLAITSARLRLSSSPYDLNGEMENLQAALAAAARSILFHGSHAQQQVAFQGGQGHIPNPLAPVVRHLPVEVLPQEILIRFAVRQAGERVGGLPDAVADRLADQTGLALRDQAPFARQKLVRITANRAVSLWRQGNSDTETRLAVFARRASGARETFSGPALDNRARRRPDVQARLLEKLTGPGLLDFLKARILGQDRALSQIVRRLQTEILTRPPHQPLRFLAQGLPGMGKSESAALLAEWLGIRKMVIDAGSFSDPQTAISQLLGSGRGIVHSHRPGRLEEIAKAPEGAVCEIADLDHAPPNVQASLADLFLQGLELGETQSATGASFGLANVIIIFTINLPKGLDTRLWQPVGFRARVDAEDLGRDVEREIANFTSTAFASRIGAPILFEPLDDAALGGIIERAVTDGIRTAVRNIGHQPGDVALEPDFGATILKTNRALCEDRGARGLLELGRDLAARAVLDLHQAKADLSARVLNVVIRGDGALTVRPSAATTGRKSRSKRT